MSAEITSQAIQNLTNDWIFQLNETDQQIADAVKQLGGKGAGLVNLVQAGFPVPDGFVITTQAYEYFVTETSLDDFIVAQIAEDSAESYSSIAVKIRQTDLPEQLKTVIRKAFEVLIPEEENAYFAVRSSGVDEDSAEHSFAGQHHTGLYVQGLLRLFDEIKQCWASMWSTSAQAYRVQRIGKPEPQAMAVVVQHMLASEVSGVAFGQIPTTGETRAFMIESCYGLGEGLVSGQVTSDNLIVNKDTLEVEQYDVQYKLSKLEYSDGKVRANKVAESAREKPTLTAEQVKDLSHYLLRIETYFNEPQDVEWAYANAQFYMLQTRPITTKQQQIKQPCFYQGSESAAVQENVIWSRMDIGEIFTGRMTPLGISFANYYQYKVHRDCGRGLGLLDLGSTPDYMAYHKGHVYLNVSYTAYLLSQTPAGADQFDFIRRFSSEEIDLSDYQNPHGNQFKFVKPKSSHFFYWLKQNLKELLTAKKRAKRMVASRFREYDNAQQQDLKSMNKTQLRETMNHALDYFKEMHQGYLPFYINAFGFYGLLEHLCHQWLKNDGKHLQNRLKGKMSNLRTVASAREVWALCQRLNEKPGLADFFKQAQPQEVLEHLHNTPEGQAFWNNDMLPFLRENGVRAREEMELTNPRWLDDPTYLITMIQVYLKQGYELDQRLELTHHSQSVDTKKLMKGLPWHKRWFLKRVISLYSACSHLREETRMSMITSIWLVRRVVYEVAQRLVDQGLINSVDDIAYADFDDVLQYIYDYEDENTLFDPRKIARSKGQHRSYMTEPEPQLTFIGSPPESKQRVTNPTEGLQGLGVSRGKVSGKVRVIHNLQLQAAEIERGEIIVAPYTDASWTPLFALAGGVVTDIGSMLSHSAIVAREFAIPSVVNTKIATQILRTGDEITLDGETGFISIDIQIHSE